MTSGRTFASGVAWSVLARVAQTVGGIVTAGMVNRAMSPAGRGVIANVQTWVGLFVTLLGLSLTSAIYHFANRERYAYGDDARLFLVLLSSAGVSVVATVGMGTLFLWYPNELSTQAVNLWFVVLALPAATIYCVNLTTLGFALGRVRLASAVGVFQSTLNVALIGPAFLLHAINLRFALLAILIVQMMGAAGMVAMLWRSVGCSPKGVSIPVVWGFLTAGLKQHVATVATFTYTTVNQLLVFHYCGEKETGLLAAALALAAGAFAAVGAAQLALYPMVIRNHGDGLAITIRMTRLGLYGGACVVVPLVAFAGPILRAYGGPRFDEAVLCFRMLVPAFWLLSVSSLTAPYYVKAGAFSLVSFVSVGLCVVSIASNAVLVPRYAANGAAFATLLTVALGFASVLGIVRVVSGASPLAALLPDFRGEQAALASWWASRSQQNRPQ